MKEIGAQSQKTIIKIGKSTCSVVCGCSCVEGLWNGVAGSPEEFLGDLASCGPSDRTFSLELGGAQGSRT